MKKIFLAAISIVCLMASCTKDEMQADPINPNEGKEVNFSSVLSPATRTLYAEEYTNAIAVKWAKGDKISVFGTTCAVNQANYEVTPASGKEDTDKDGTAETPYYYAESLTKTGAAGVQWGNEETSDFYAVYPSTNNAFTDNGDGSVTVKTTVRAEQNVAFTFNKATNTWVGQHYHTGDASNPTMTDAVMYAVTANASSTAEKVDLNFKPFSTVLRFTFKGYQAYKDFLVTDANPDGTPDTAYDTTPVSVTKIVLSAPNANIAGDFDLTIKNDGSAKATKGTSQVIEIYPDYLPMKNGEQLQFDVFTIPQEGVELPVSAEKAWTVQVVTNMGTYVYNLRPQKVDADATGLALKTGALHKITIPQKKVIFDFTLQPENWLRYIPRNVYLSELSMPGAWYATNSDYQGSATLTDMYNAGVRAFNIDCRMTASASSWTKKSFFITYYELNSNPTYLLQCAGSETLTGQKVGGIERVSNVADGLTVESQLETLSGLIKDDEYIMVVLTLAEKPKDLSGALSDESETFGNNVDPANVLAALKDILTRKGKTLKVFGYRDQDAGKTLNANTTVNDVLGSMVIKVNVNVDQDATELANYGMSNVLLSEGSMASETKYITSPIVAGSFTSMNMAPMYWGSTKISDPAMNYYYHQAQLTTSSTTATSGSATPSLFDRQKAIDLIVDQAYQVYATNDHNALFQLGIGGYINSGSEDRATVASTLNKYVLEQWVTPKLTGATKEINGVNVVLKPSPIGIVLMNHCVTAGYSGPELVKAILELNTKYYLNRNHGADEWPDGNPFQTSGDSGTDGGGTGGDDDGQQDEV